jgi:hypothetical protein
MITDHRQPPVDRPLLPRVIGSIFLVIGNLPITVLA